jgi:uncharacterized membrane protein
VVVVAVVWTLLHVGWYAHENSTDYHVYRKYGYAVVERHKLPYRDFSLEYPPGALPMFVAPALVQRSDYVTVFQALMALCLAAAALGVLAMAGLRAALLAAVLPLALGSLVLSRFDLWPTALTSLGLVALLRRRFTLSAVLLGTAFSAKLWPALLVPLIVVWLARNADRRQAARWLLMAAATAALWFLPFVVAAPAGVGHSFHRQLGRPLQIESLGGAMLVAIHDIWNTPLGNSSTFGSDNLVGPHTAAVATALTAVEVLALIGIFVAFWRSEATTGALIRYSAAAVTVAIAFGKVFSPQFLLWLIPLVLIVRGRRGLAAAAGLFAACVLTQIYYPAEYEVYARYFYARPTLIVLTRDLLVVAIAVVLAATPLRRVGRPETPPLHCPLSERPSLHSQDGPNGL